MKNKNKIGTQEERIARGNNFLKWVSYNDEELRNILKRNVDYNKEMFDDNFQDTIINIYNCIVEKGYDIKEEAFKNYFFVAAKRNYIILKSTAYRKESRKVDFEYWALKNDVEDSSNLISDIFSDNVMNVLRNEIFKDAYLDNAMDIFFGAMMEKANGMCLKKYAKKMNVPYTTLQGFVKRYRNKIINNKRVSQMLKYGLDI